MPSPIAERLAPEGRTTVDNLKRMYTRPSNRAIAYTRVSDDKQRDGASLSAQRREIEAYAKAKGLQIVRFIEEVESASVKGRSQFRELLRRFKAGEAETIVFHKLDRSARNWHDWAKLTEIMDKGTSVHFAAEGVDSSTPGVRIMLDMMAAVATNYSRNLSTEVRKGLRERLRQGLYPWTAPVGYLSASALEASSTVKDSAGRRRHPKAGVKVVDPEKGPLVRRAFELSARGWSIAAIAKELGNRGLTSGTGRPISVPSLGKMFRNPFYIGRMCVAGEEYEGRHAPLVSLALFDEVQERLTSKRTYRRASRKERLPFALRGMIICATCGKSLLPERHKQIYVYYRCHTVKCPERTLREADALASLREDLSQLRLNKAQLGILREMVHQAERAEMADEQRLEAQQAAKRVRLKQLLDSLTEKFVAGAIDEPAYMRLKRKYDLQLSTEKTTPNSDSSKMVISQIERYLELPELALSSLSVGPNAETHQILKSVYSNFWGQGKKLVLEPKAPFRALRKCTGVLSGGPGAVTARNRNTKEAHVNAVRELIELLREEAAAASLS